MTVLQRVINKKPQESVAYMRKGYDETDRSAAGTGDDYWVFIFAEKECNTQKESITSI
jgi:hypothetical protein